MCGHARNLIFLDKFMENNFIIQVLIAKRALYGLSNTNTVSGKWTIYIIITTRISICSQCYEYFSSPTQ